MKWKTASLIAIVICFVVGLVLWLDDSSKQTLPDGTVLVMSGVKIARTNVYTHGTWLSKTLGRFAPSGGISFAGFKLERPTMVTYTAPEGSESLTAQLRLLPGSPRQNTLVSPPFHRKFRLLIPGDDDYVFVREFDGFRQVADGCGNFDHFTFSKVVTNDWMMYRIFRPLDPTKPWRFQVHVALDSDYPATNLFPFTIRQPLTGTIQTNLGGFQVQIGCNDAGWLNVELMSKQAETRLTFVKAVDDAGNDLDNWSGSWGQHSFWKSLKSSNPGQIDATVAIHPNYPTNSGLWCNSSISAREADGSGANPAS